MYCKVKKVFSLLCLFLFCFSAVRAEEKQDSWICLNCGRDTRGDCCEVCGSLRDAWICYTCGTRNLSSTCMNCGKTRDESLTLQASDPRPLTAYPAVRILAASGDSDALKRLGQYFEKGIEIGRAHV